MPPPQKIKRCKYLDSLQKELPPQKAGFPLKEPPAIRHSSFDSQMSIDHQALITPMWPSSALDVAQQMKRTIVRCPFTHNEDKELQHLVACHGMNWEYIATLMPGRNVRQVKERWTNYLSSDVENRPWTPDEDALLREKFSEFGSKWKRISSFFEKRSDVHVKNRWRLLQRAEMRTIRKQQKLLLQEATRIYGLSSSRRRQNKTVSRSSPIKNVTETQSMGDFDMDPDLMGSDSFFGESFEVLNLSFSDFAAF